jgi:metallophosphoesterase (TIGR00282 family)
MLKIRMSLLKILFLGDIVGSSGRQAIAAHLPILKSEHAFDLIIANGENAAHGFGLTMSIATELFEMGIDVLTGGNHTWDKKEIHQALQTYSQKIIRPANYPTGTAGRGSTIVHGKSGHKIGIVNLMGRVFMDPLDCPFRALQNELETLRRETKIILVDLHAEVTSEKEAMAWFADGQVSAVVGTHTHVQTADERIFPKGTGFLSDAGMNGPYDSIIGMKREIILERFLKKQPVRMEVAEGPGVCSGVIFTIDSDDGTCKKIERVRRTPQ